MPTPRRRQPTIGNAEGKELGFQGKLAAIHAQLSYLSNLVLDLGAQHERELAKAGGGHLRRHARQGEEAPLHGRQLGALKTGDLKSRSFAQPGDEVSKVPSRCSSSALKKFGLKRKMPSVCFDFEVSEIVHPFEEVLDEETAVAEVPYRSGISSEGLPCSEDSQKVTQISLDLMYALISGSESDVGDILSLSADPNATFTEFFCNGKRFVSGLPLALAVLGGRRDCLRLLVAARADLESRYSFAAGAQQLIWSGPAAHATIPQGDRQMLEDLLDLGADLHSVGSNGATMVWQAAYFDQPEILEMLIQRKANIGKRAQSQDDASLTLTPLHTAAAAGHPSTVMLLLRARASPLVDNGGISGTSALEDAIYGGHDKVVQLLVAASADLFRPVAQLHDSGTSSWNSFLSSVTSEKRMRCIDLIFRSQNSGLIAAVAKGLKEAPSLCDRLCNIDLVHFLTCPGDAPVDILAAIFRPFQLRYWTMEGKQLRRAVRLAAFISDKGLNVVEGPHLNSILEAFNSKEIPPPTMLQFIDRLAPATYQNKSVYKPASFFMCSVPLAHQDLNVLRAIADCSELEIFRGPGCHAIVALKWRGARLTVRFQILLHIVELANIHFIIYTVHTQGEVSPTPVFRVSAYLAAFLWLVAIIIEIARCIGYLSCGLKRRYFLNIEGWLSKVEILLIGGIQYRLWLDRYGLVSDELVRVILGVASCGKWMALLRELKVHQTVGLRILPVIATLREAGPFCLVLVAVLLATSSFYWSLGIHSFADCFMILFQLFALGEGDLLGMENHMGPDMKLPSWEAWSSGGEPDILQELPPRTRYYWLLRVMFVTLSFLVGVSLMNLYVAIICSRYVQCAENAWLLFMRCRVCRVLDHHAMCLGFSVVFCKSVCRKGARGFISMGSATSLAASRMSLATGGMSCNHQQQHCPYLGDTAYVWFACHRELGDQDNEDGGLAIAPKMSTMSRVKTLKGGSA